MNKAKQKIPTDPARFREWLEAVLPDEHPADCPNDTNYCRGWIACLDQIRENLKE